MICAALVVGFNPDLNGDRVVNAIDIAAIVTNWDDYTPNDLAHALNWFGAQVVVSVADESSWLLPASCEYQFTTSPFNQAWTRITWATPFFSINASTGEVTQVDFHIDVEN